MERRHEQRALHEDAKATNDELRSLQSRQSNLPRRSLELRARLCADLGIDPGELPFAGELIQVSEDAPEWEGAAERVLHAFALSLLVPTAHYADVSRWIDDHHLGARLVYFRVPARAVSAPPPARSGPGPLLVDLLDVKPDSPLAPWVLAELDRRASHRCVASVADFPTADRAVTRNGQIKSRDRHEKDDRTRIDDRREYVLGWTNAAKIDALIAHAHQLNNQLADLDRTIGTLDGRRRDLTGQRTSLDRLAEYGSWEDLDWQSLVTAITDRQAEARRVRESSDELARLTTELDDVRERIGGADAERSRLEGERGGAQSRHDQATQERGRVERHLADEDAVATARREHDAVTALITELRLSLTDRESLGDVHQRTASALSERIRAATETRGRVEGRIVRAMARFRTAYPQETAELDDSLASAHEYRALHERVATDDLPRFEREFKEYLNQNTIRDIASLTAQLNKQETIIRDRVTTINGSLRTIDYNPGRYIHLVLDRSPNTEIRLFREDLRACTDNIVGQGDDEQYSEARFLQVKAIVDRFKGREGMVDQDRTWTRRVTDVRQWFVFSASERWRDSDAEYESYTDSAGKSGGQKEKLAYTILAASLAYQFKLDGEATSSRAFRFVVIDEAFGRGSDDSTRYALSLFTRLGLQLLIVTPLQKIHVIEPHVSAVGFVDNLTGSYSRLQCLTVTEHRRRRSERVAPSAGPG